MPRVGLLTIGQSPRTDVTREFKILLSDLEDLEFVEAGALDDFTLDEISRKLSPEPGHTVYVSRLRDGTQVMISREKIIPLVKEKIRKLEELGADLIVLLCSGEFPRFESRVPVIYPRELLVSCVRGISATRPIAVVIPLREQEEYAKKKWIEIMGNDNFLVVSLSPYASSLDDFERLAEKLSLEKPSLVIMDCIGYTLKQKKVLREKLGAPVVTTRGITAAFVKELLFK